MILLFGADVTAAVAKGILKTDVRCVRRGFCFFCHFLKVERHAADDRICERRIGEETAETEDYQDQAEFFHRVYLPFIMETKLLVGWARFRKSHPQANYLYDRLCFLRQGIAAP